MRKTIKRTGFIAVSAVALTTVGVAFAAWTSNGSGSGTAKSDTVKDVVFATSTTSDVIYPTGTSDVVISVTNPNSYKATLSSFAMTAAYDAADSNIGNLGTANTQPTDIMATCGLSLRTVASVTVVSGASSLTITDGLSMSNAVSNVVSTCANKTFVLALNAVANSADAATATPGTTTAS